MPDPSDLSHIPHLPTQPLVGHTLLSLRDFPGFARRNTEAFGEVYRVKTMGRWRISFTSAEAAEYILMDPDRLFSSRQGWHDTLGALFSGGLMLRDFDDHRQHRRIMQIKAFTRALLSRWRVRGVSGEPVRWKRLRIPQ